jgi:NADPH2:quinone reductase
LQIPEGGWFLQSAANSELGRMMISLCKHRGVKSINVVRREEAAQELLAAGWVFHLKSPLFLNEAILALAMR